MKKIADYRIVRGGDANDLQAKVREAVLAGLQPLGAPLVNGRDLMQAMVLPAAEPEPQTLSPAAAEAQAQLAGVTAESASQVLVELESAVDDASGQSPAAAQLEP